MATGGIFTIITNDGKQDKMLMATQLLHERLRSINAFKLSQNGGAPDDLKNLPTLLDIEKTHVLFTNAHFKPFAAIGFEYNKVRATSGNPTLGQTITFSIPQFGDFFHDIAAHVVLTQPTLNSTATYASDAPAMRWCHFPGERLFKSVRMEVNGNPLDSYESHAVNLHREFRVAPNKLAAWRRCVGQEEPELGFVRQPDWESSGVAPTDHRVAAQVHVGNQTPSSQKSGNLELFIPLLFWYNKDVRLSVPSVAIPYGQRFINIDLATRAELVDVVPRGASTWASPAGSLSDSGVLQTIELYINNIFMNPEVHKIYIKRVGFSLIRVHRQQIYNANSSSAEVLLQQLKWPIEYLFVAMKVKEYHASSSSAAVRQHLDNWHRFSKVTETTYRTTGQSVNRETALAVESTTTTLGVGTPASGIAPLAGTATLKVAVAAGDTLRIGNGLYVVTTGASAGSAVTSVSVGAVAAVTATVALQQSSRVLTAQGLEIVTKKFDKTVNNITLKAHGINIYDNMPAAFFNAYTPYHYGGANVNSPSDIGALFIPFCLYPGSYQPSGHINISRAREFYIYWDSSVVTSNVEGTLIVLASAINFLLISDGSAVLRYST